MKRKIELCMSILLLICMIILSRRLSQMVTSEDIKSEADAFRNVVVVDAGHGGHDPGKIGVNDAAEKDINLAIAHLVKGGLEQEGIQVVMTREDDTAEETKLGDMRKRVSLINEVLPDITVSIHQNSYPDGSVCGPQVFYFEESEVGMGAATVMQEELKKLEAENAREIKANDNFYMLKKTLVPTIIVECGFLSNALDAEKLVTEEYQKQMADTICQGIIKWLDK